MQKIIRNTKKVSAFIISLALLIAFPGISAYAGETGISKDTENFMDGRHYGYEEPQDMPYVFAEDGEEAAKGTAEITVERVDGILRSSITDIFKSAPNSRYITSVASYPGGGAAPNVANSLKADNQQKTGLCWIYATNKAMEANLYLKGRASNLSEKNTAYYFWNKADVTGSEGDALRNAYNYMTYAGSGTSAILKGRELYDRGGNTLYLDNYLAAWKGVVLDSGNNQFEQDAIADKTKMFTVAGAITTPVAKDAYSGNIGHVQNIYRTPATDSDAIKTLIKKYGAVTSSVYASGLVVKSGTNAWYNPVDSTVTHQITIIGWDDDYSRDNFKGYATEKYGKPSSNGAWYCMNSWGQGGGNYCDTNGGFWLSYEDKSFSSNTLYATAFDVAANGTDAFYDHNYVPATASSLKTRWLYMDKGTTCGNAYTASGTGNSTGFEQIKAVGFNTYQSDSKWVIRGYKGTNADSGILVSEQTVTIPYVGYHTVELSTPFKVHSGESFYIELQPVGSYYVEFANAGSTVDQSYNSTVEYNGRSYPYKTTMKFGEPFGTSYLNGTKQTADSNGAVRQFIIHAYTNDCSSPDYSRITTASLSASYKAGQTFALSSFYTFTAGRDDAGNATTITSAKSSNTSVAAVSLADNRITVNGTGTATITLTTSDYVTARITVTVSRYALSASNTEVSGIGDYTYDGAKKTPEVTVKANGATLTEGRDYSVSYGANTNAGTGSVTITGTGNYSGSKTENFNIAARTLTQTDVSGVDSQYQYTGSAICPVPMVTANGTELVSGTDYTVSYDTNTDIGNGTVTITGKSNYTGTVNIPFEIKNTVTKSILRARERVTLTYGDRQSITFDEIMTFSAGTDAYGQPTTLKSVSSDNLSVAEIMMDAKRIKLYQLNSGTANIRFETSDGCVASTAVTVTPRSVSTEDSVYISNISNTYRLGDEIVTVDPEIGFEHNGLDVPLSEGRDYTLSYIANDAPGYGYVQINGIGNFSDSVKKYFRIVSDTVINETEDKTILFKQNGDVAVDDLMEFVPGYEIDPDVASPSVGAGNGVKETTIRTISSSDPAVLAVKEGNSGMTIKKAGETEITVTASDGISATVRVSVAPADVDEFELSGIEDEYHYTGSAITPEPVVTISGNVLKKDTDYMLDYSYCTDIGTGIITITGTGNYTGIKEAGFLIVPEAISKATISGVNASYDYTGNEICPKVSVSYKGITLEKEKDYTVTYTDNVNTGTARYTVNGQSNFNGSASGTFLIKKPGENEPDPKEGTLEATTGLPSKGAVYTGKEIKPAVTVKYTKNGVRTTVGADEYDVEYSSNVNVGTATAKITMSAAYGNKVITKTFTIYPAKIGSAAITGIKKSYVYADVAVIPAMTLTYNNMALAEGTDYTVEYTDNNAPGTATYTLTGINNFSGERTGEYTINAEATGEEEIEVPVDPIPETPDEPDPEPQPEDPEDNPETPEENKGEQPSEAEKAVTESDNKPMDYRTEEKGEYKISYGHGVPFWGNSKITAEYFGHITISHNGAEYKATKIKVNKKKRLIQILKLAGADKATVKAVKKATKGSAGLSFTMNPYYVKNSDTVSIKTKKDGSIKSLKVTINGKAYKAKKSEFSQDSSTGKISFSGNLAGSYGGNETGSEASAASIETVNISNAGDYDTVYAPEDVPEAPETKETADIEETVETEEKIEYGASEEVYEEAESVSSNEIAEDDNASGTDTDEEAEEMEDTVTENEERLEEDNPEIES